MPPDFLCVFNGVVKMETFSLKKKASDLSIIKKKNQNTIGSDFENLLCRPTPASSGKSQLRCAERGPLLSDPGFSEYLPHREGK